MAAVLRTVSIIGATGALGSRIASTLKAAGHTVTAVQRKDSSKSVPEGFKTVKVNYQNKEELVSAFTGQEVVISAAPFPQLDSEKIIIEACIAASVKRFMPSEYTTMLESPLAINLPLATEKVRVRQYLNSVLTNPTGLTTWTSINNGAFLDMALKFGVLGPNPMAKKAVFHDGGDKTIAVSTLSDIATAIAKILEQDSKFEAAANQPVYICSAAVTERRLTKMVAEVTGIDFGTPEEVSVKELIAASAEKLKQGDKSAMVSYYFQMMYGEGYKGGDFMEFNWNERLGLRFMSEQELKDTVAQILNN
ncbi:NAD(P)-binding protein [Aspergillus ellipticus CBS 707.79]|uniref:NAD(P)-binding protein n=1 Tax=Aspergillus ellipticus CBS 707.79 TaxID=1448320 RepID=A0A319E806_9EURO|nr:NAD(P)-binding protein [Aspergillus ellipticus CBS 707.79]